MTKAGLRKQYRQKRAALPASSRALMSQQITERLLRSDLLATHESLHLYLPIGRLQEVDTLLIAAAVRQQYPSMQLVLPVVQAETGQLGHMVWDDHTQITESSWGIPEPQGGQPFAAELLTAVLVPLLAYDVQGQRLGYGKGFYDRFLAACPGALKIGLSYFEPEPALPHEPHDIPLDLCICPEALYQFPVQDH